MLLGYVELQGRSRLPEPGAEVNGVNDSDQESRIRKATRPNGRTGRILRPTLLWLALLVAGRVLWGLSGSWGIGLDSVLSWITYISANLGFVLPFLLFATGVGLAGQFPLSRPLIRVALSLALLLGVLSYVLLDWVVPLASYRDRISSASATVETAQFGPPTPAGVLRKLRYVEANPPAEYSLSVEAPERHPPNVLRWRLHQPAAMGVFGLVNVFLGMLTAQLTADLRRRSRRNARVAIGVLGGIAFFVCMMLASPIEPFLRDGTLRPGALSAWAPLALPLTEALLLGYLIRRRRG